MTVILEETKMASTNTIDSEHNNKQNNGHITVNYSGRGHKIPIIISNRHTSDKTNAQAKVFKGKYRGRIKIYYIGGVHPESSPEGHDEYLEDRGITAVDVSLITSKSGDLAAKVTIPHYQGEIVEDEHFWPKFMRCREWLPRHSFREYRKSLSNRRYNQGNTQNTRNNANGDYNRNHLMDNYCTYQYSVDVDYFGD